MIQTTEQYQFLYSTLAQYSSQLQHNQVLVLIEMMFRLDYRCVDEEMFKCHQIKGTVQLGLNTVFPPQQNQQNPEDHVSIQLQNLQLGNMQDVKN